MFGDLSDSEDWSTHILALLVFHQLFPKKIVYMYLRVHEREKRGQTEIKPTKLTHHLCSSLEIDVKTPDTQSNQITTERRSAESVVIA